MAESGIAIVAGRGALPRLIAEDCARRGRPYRVVQFEGIALDWLDGHPVLAAAFEKPGRLFAALRAAGCGEVTFAGGMKRPHLNPLRFDLKALGLATKLFAGLRAGDDTTLRLAAEIFEAEGLTLRAPHEILASLLAPEGLLTRRAPTEADRLVPALDAAVTVKSPMFAPAKGGGGIGLGSTNPFGTRLGWYADLIRQRVAEKWRTQDLDSKLNNFEAIVTFDIRRDGSVTNIRLIQRSGNYTVDTSAMRAVMVKSWLA